MMKTICTFSALAAIGALTVLLFRMNKDDQQITLGQIQKPKQANRDMAGSATSDTDGITRHKDRRKRGADIPIRFTGSDFKQWLDGKKGNTRALAEAMAIAGMLTGNPDLIRQAIESDPKNPQLLYIGSTHSSLTEKEHLHHSEEFFLQDESNALAAYIYAAQLFKSGDSQNGIRILSSSQDRPRIDSFAYPAQLLMDEAHVAAGSSPAQAKMLSMLNLSLPYYSQLQSMADTINSLSYNLPPDAAADLRALAASMGMRLNQQAGSVTFIDHMMGLKLEETTLAGLARDAPSPYAGMTVEQARIAITSEREELRKVMELAPLEDILSGDPKLLDGFLERFRFSGELEATKWWIDATTGNR